MNEIKRWPYCFPKPICGPESPSAIWAVQILEKRGYEAIIVTEGDRFVIYYAEKQVPAKREVTA